MRIPTLLIFISLFELPVHLQITIESSDLPQGGTTYPLVNTLFMELDLLDIEGSDVIWDASNLIPLNDSPVTPSPISDASITAALVFNSPFNSTYQCEFFLPTEFPDLGIDLGIPLDGFNSFYQTDDNHYAIAGIGLSSAGFDLPVTYDDIDEIFPLPITFGETFSSSGSFSLDLEGILGYWLNQTRDVVADGWGTLILPSGSFEALRIKTNLVANDSIAIDQLGEPFAIERVQTIYQWWAKDMGLPLLEVTTTLGVPTFSTFYNADAPSSVGSENTSLTLISPNPARLGSPIQWGGTEQSPWTLTNMQGQFVATGMENSWTIPESYEAGTYLFMRDGVTQRLIIG
ncbi:MAG TPA: hypothetical protein DCF87_00745, partial [Opitutae bacterium]|nr:hypothetical protein [Opitutae bacterium]